MTRLVVIRYAIDREAVIDTARPLAIGDRTPRLVIRDRQGNEHIIPPGEVVEVGVVSLVGEPLRARPCGSEQYRTEDADDIKATQPINRLRGGCAGIGPRTRTTSRRLSESIQR